MRCTENSVLVSGGRMESTSTEGPSDEELAALVSRMRRIRRRNRLAHVAAAGVLVVVAVTVWCVYAYVIFQTALSRAQGRFGMLVAGVSASITAGLVHARLRSKEVVDDDA